MTGGGQSPWIRIFREVWDHVMEMPGAKTMEANERVSLSLLITQQLHAEADSYLTHFDAKRAGEALIITPRTDDHAEWTQEADAELEQRLRECDLHHLISEWVLAPESDNRRQNRE